MLADAQRGPSKSLRRAAALAPGDVQFMAKSSSTALVRRVWATRSRGLTATGVWMLAVAAIVWQAWEFWRLLFQTGPMGAVDLGLRHTEVHRWFVGQPVYEAFQTAVYPPGTYAILWPLLGWSEFAAARWIWGFTTVVAMALLVWLFLRGSTAKIPREQWLIGLMALGTYPAGATIGNGQLTIHVLLAAMGAVLVVAGGVRDWRRFALAVCLGVFAMVKPTSAVTFLTISLVLPGGIGVVGTTVVAYAGVTLIAAAFQPASLPDQIEAWLARGAALGGYAGDVFYANLHAWLSAAGLSDYLMAASLFVEAVIAGWVFAHRRSDVWVLLGVAAIVTRVWTYHRWYDDLLILVSMVALSRIAKTGVSAGLRAACGVLFAVTLVTMLAPGGLYLLPRPWNVAYTWWETALWAGQGVVLGKAANEAKETDSRSLRTRRSLPLLL